MSGQGTRYQLAGYSEPKPLIPVSGVPMVERLLSCFPSHWPTHFVMAENHRPTALPEALRRLRPDGEQLFIPPHKLGPSYALLKALTGVPPDAPVLVSYCDYGMLFDAAAFERFVRSSACDFCLISYRGFHAHYLSPTTYAYSRLHGERVVQVREKGSFTADREDEYASTGGYYFRTAELLRQAIEYQIAHDIQLNGEFYTSLTVEALLRMEPTAHGRVFEIPGFFQWGTPDDLRNFEFWERSFAAYNRVAGRTWEVAQVLMPMAGLGSRFSPFTATPKPLIPVAGRPMFRAALDSLPSARRTVLVALQSMVADLTPHLGRGRSGGARRRAAHDAAGASAVDGGGARGARSRAGSPGHRVRPRNRPRCRHLGVLSECSGLRCGDLYDARISRRRPPAAVVQLRRPASVSRALPKRSSGWP